MKTKLFASLLFIFISIYCYIFGLPPGLNHDAAIYAGYAQGVLTGQYPLTPYWEAHWGRETGLPHLKWTNN